MQRFQIYFDSPIFDDNARCVLRVSTTPQRDGAELRAHVRRNARLGDELLTAMAKVLEVGGAVEVTTDGCRLLQTTYDQLVAVLYRPRR